MQTEIKNQLGSELSKLVFDQSHDEIKKYLGLLPPLNGPGKEVLISPSDHLLQENSLRKPIYSSFIKACTHVGILAIGEESLEIYRQGIEAKIRSKLYEDLIDEKNMCKAEKRRAVEVSLQKTKERYKNCILVLKCNLKKKMETELEKTIVECQRKMQEQILQQRADITREMIKKLRDEVGFVVTSLYQNFENNLYRERQNMIAEFNQIMRRDRLKTDTAVREMIRKKEEEFQITLKELELQKIVDLTYLLFSERIRCSSEKYEIQHIFEKQVEALQQMLLEANHVIELIKEKPFEKEDDKMYQEKIVDIVNQFQKFINFAFRAVPGQADFLLSLESLLKVELGQKTFKRPEKEEKKKEEIEENGIFYAVEMIDKCDQY